MADWEKAVYGMFADFGDWLVKKSKNGESAIILAVLSIIFPLGLFFVLGFIASSNRKRGRKH